MSEVAVVGIRTSKTEIVDLLKSWLAITIAFTIASTGLQLGVSTIPVLLISALAVATAFILHELGHKFVAQHFGCFAEFRSFDAMLLLAVALSVTGFIFAAPGAVMISGMVTRRENGIISVAGPLTNYVLAAIFWVLILALPAYATIWGRCFIINAWIGLFNMIPFGNFDGIKIFHWNYYVWTAMVALGIAFLFIMPF